MITPGNRNVIKTQVVALVAMVPPIIQLPLGDTIGIIADSDFHKEWMNLVPVRPSRYTDSGSGVPIQHCRSGYDQRDVANCTLSF